VLLRGTLAVACIALSVSVDADQAGDEAQLKALHAELVQLIGAATCINLVHCRVVALGTRPCGGAAEYLAYSNLAGQSKREAIEAKAYEYTFLFEDLQRATKQVGTCEVLSQPRPACVDGRCRIDAGVQ
jgi:hypothetical protein